MEINSNSRNKPTADQISNKNAFASNNVLFVSNVVRCFHWLCSMLKTPCLLHVELAIFCVCCFILPFLPIAYCQHGDLWPAGQPITLVVFQHMRGLYLGVKGGEFNPQFSTVLLKKNAHALLFLHYHCIRVVCICCFWHVDIAVQCCQFSVFS